MIFLLITILLLELIFKPRLDFAGGRLILWYNYNKTRTYTLIYDFNN